MSNTPTGGKEVDAVLASKRFDSEVFREVFFGFVLDIMVEGENGLLGVCDLGSSYGFKPTVDRISPGTQS